MAMVHHYSLGYIGPSVVFQKFYLDTMAKFMRSSSAV